MHTHTNLNTHTSNSIYVCVRGFRLVWYSISANSMQFKLFFTDSYNSHLNPIAKHVCVSLTIYDEECFISKPISVVCSMLIPEANIYIVIELMKSN